VILVFERAERVGDALERVLDRVGEIVHREDAPPGALAMVVDVADAVDDGVAHVEVAGGQVDLRAQGPGALGELAVFHAGEELEVFLHRAVPVGGDGGLADVAAVFLKLLGREVADVGQALFNELDRVFVVLVEVVRPVEEAVAPVEAQPVDVVLDGLDVLGVLLRGVRVVHAEIAQAAELFGGAEIDAESLAVADVQVAVRLRRKARVDSEALKLSAGGDVLLHKVVDKVF